MLFIKGSVWRGWAVSPTGGQEETNYYSWWVFHCQVILQMSDCLWKLNYMRSLVASLYQLMYVLHSSCFIIIYLSCFFIKKSVATYLLIGPPSMGKHDLKQKLIRENPSYASPIPGRCSIIRENPSYASPIPGRCSINYSEWHSLWNNRFQTKQELQLFSCFSYLTNAIEGEGIINPTLKSIINWSSLNDKLHYLQ